MNTLTLYFVRTGDVVTVFDHCPVLKISEEAGINYGPQTENQSSRCLRCYNYPASIFPPMVEFLVYTMSL